MNPTTIQLIQDELNDITNDKIKDKISFDFIDKLAQNANKTYLHPTPIMRICILQLTTGHEVYGVAQVLKAENDDAVIGNQVAYDRARDEIWSTIGSIAKALI